MQCAVVYRLKLFWCGLERELFVNKSVVPINFKSHILLVARCWYLSVKYQTRFSVQVPDRCCYI
jgi:hypothetical protein